MIVLNLKKQLVPQVAIKKNQTGFSSSDMIVAIASIGILATITFPLLTPVIEFAEVLILERYLLGAVKECQMGLINGDRHPVYTMPPQSIGLGFIKKLNAKKNFK